MLLKISPVPKPRMTRADAWKQRDTVVRYFKFCDKLREEYQRPIKGGLRLTFYVQMPKSWPKKKKLLMEGMPHQQRPDLDNYIKAFLDALCSDRQIINPNDDSFVWHIEAKKIWATEGAIEVEDI